jgi:hypothetical protein
MIHEYALEPELVATWGNRHDYRYFIEKFGLGQPRIVSRFPKRWKRLVWDTFRSDNELERKRMEELLAQLSERMVHRRDYNWEPTSTWIANAHNEHGRFPFHAILARENPAGHPATLVLDQIGDSSPLWAVARGVTIARSATAMAGTVAAMLRIAEVVIFVDPYFGPERSRHRRPLEAFLRAVSNGRPLGAPGRVEVQTSQDRTGTLEFFQDECRNRLRRCVPAGQCLVLRRLRERPGGESLHNRYILTDLGGVIFPQGLDDGDTGETDDVTLMDRAQFEARWQQHDAGAPAFESPEGTIEISRVGG